MASSLNNNRCLKRNKIFLSCLFIAVALTVNSQDTVFNTAPYVEAEKLWYLETPVWIGAAVVIFLLLIALLRRRPNKKSQSATLANGKFTVKKIKQHHPKI